MAQGRGSGKTPERVVSILREAVEKSSQSAVAKETGLPIGSINRYINGIGEPSQATILKIAKCYDVSVAWLRGEFSREKHNQMLEVAFNKSIDMAMDKNGDYATKQTDKFERLILEFNEDIGKGLENPDLISSFMSSANIFMYLKNTYPHKFESERLEKINTLIASFKSNLRDFKTREFISNNTDIEK